MTDRPNHPLAPPSGRLAVSRIVLYDKIGPGPHACHWCGKPIDWEKGLSKTALLADHLDWNIFNDAPENLVPSCLACNGHRRKGGKAELIREDELTVPRPRGGRTRAVVRVCQRCGTEFMVPPAVVKNGRGRFCSHACRNRHAVSVRWGT